MPSWKESLRLGVVEIDTQHEQLCNAIDRLLDACRNAKGRQEILETVSFLEDYTVKHFSDEEKLQASCGYPKLKEHKALHEGFIQKIKDVKSDIDKNGANIGSVANLNMLLLDWLIKHIKGVDKELSEYLIVE